MLQRRIIEITTLVVYWLCLVPFTLFFLQSRNILNQKDYIRYLYFFGIAMLIYIPVSRLSMTIYVNTKTKDIEIYDELRKSCEMLSQLEKGAAHAGNDKDKNFEKLVNNYVGKCPPKTSEYKLQGSYEALDQVDYGENAARLGRGEKPDIFANTLRHKSCDDMLNQLDNGANSPKSVTYGNNLRYKSCDDLLNNDERSDIIVNHFMHKIREELKKSYEMLEMEKIANTSNRQNLNKEHNYAKIETKSLDAQSCIENECVG